MRELRSISHNISILMHEDSEQPMVEVILLLSEPQYAIDASGMFAKSRNLTDFRFGTTPKGLRDLAETLIGMADEAEHLCSGFIGTSEKS